MTEQERKEKIEAFTAQFFERTEDLLMVSAAIEAVIHRRLELRRKLELQGVKR
jgi:hypothetical protein